jgi:hypothetical protein
LSEEDVYWIESLKYNKLLSGRSRDNKLSKLLGITKQRLSQIDEISSYIARPENFERIEPGACPPDKLNEMREMYYKAWQRHLAKPLSKQELAKVKENV